MRTIIITLLLIPLCLSISMASPVIFNDQLENYISSQNTNKTSKCPWPVLKAIADMQSQNSSKTNTSAFWQEKEKGWFFTKEENKRKDECKISDFSFLTADFLRSLPAPVFKQLIDDLMNYAVTNPTPENIKPYMYAQWIAREKSTQFMMAWSEVLRSHPSMDYTVARAPFAYATTQQVVFQAKARDNFIRQASSQDKIALVAFVSPQCVYCATQMPIILNIRKKYGIRVSFINVKEHPDVIGRFGIEALPEVWLAVKGHGMTRISAGLRSGDQIVEGIVSAYEELTGEKILPDIYKYTQKIENLNLKGFKKPDKEISPWEENMPLY